jgi:FRG domain
MQIGSVRKLLEVLKDGTHSEDRLFRGQTRDWPLLPSIGRYPTVVRGYDDWVGFHDDIIDRFLRLGHPFLPDHSKNNAESWVIAQHHGLPTRLLDATTNPLKGLFFAINHPAEDAYDGVLWVFSYTSWREDLDEEHHEFWEKELVPFFPAQLTSRLTAQEGAFISYPLPKNRKSLRPIDKLKQDDFSLLKLTIPAAQKATLRREIATLGIQFRLLFPDLDGVARSIRLTELES